MKHPWFLLLPLTAAVLGACEKQGEHRQGSDTVTIPHREGGEEEAPPAISVPPSERNPDKPVVAPMGEQSRVGAPSQGLASTLPLGAARPEPTKPTAVISGPVGAASVGESARTIGTYGTLSDGQILHFTDTANGGEIEQGRMAEKKAKDAEVRAFAKLMIDEHGEAREKGRALSQRTGIMLAGNAASADLKEHAEASMKALKKPAGPSLDRAYMRDQIAQHEEVLKRLDEDLIPQASATDLKEYLGDLRRHVIHHLEMAQKTAERLGPLDAT